MKWIITPYFEKQISRLKKKYRLISSDIQDFFDSYNSETAHVDLGSWLMKFRSKNSSIPVGKSGGFRIILFQVNNDQIIPLLIYSKTHIENVSEEEIENALEIVLEEIEDMQYEVEILERLKTPHSEYLTSDAIV